MYVKVSQGSNVGRLMKSLTGDTTEVVITAAPGVAITTDIDLIVGGGEWTFDVTAQGITESAGGRR